MFPNDGHKVDGRWTAWSHTHTDANQIVLREAAIVTGAGGGGRAVLKALDYYV